MHGIDPIRRRTAPLAAFSGLTALAASLALGGCARQGRTAGSDLSPNDTGPALSVISERDLAIDLEELAGDAMRGREAGTLDELRASAWLAARARQANLEPAGDDGTYFQFWPMRRIRLSDASRVAIDGAPVELWRDIVVTAATDVALDAPVVFLAAGAADEATDLRGKAVVAPVTRPANAPAPGVSLSAWRYARLAVVQQGRALAERGAAAVILVADSIADQGIPFYAANAQRGTYGIDSAGGEHRPRPQTPVLLARSSLLPRLQGAARLSLSLSTESFVYPSVNVVALARGTDAQLGKEYVLFSSHQDHDGVRAPVNGDSIWNGADDNATTSVAILAIGRGWARKPGKRSALFVWHGAEERGLLGSRWHAAHPVVPRSSIVAVLNADMIGRGHPDSAALLGVQPPHRNSTRLAQAALRANDLVSQFRLDTLWDRPTHPEGWYFRSDHLPYARAGVPALFFTTLLHPDYHTPRDEPRTIDVVKMARVARWMYMTGWLVSQEERRPEVDPGFRLER